MGALLEPVTARRGLDESSDHAIAVAQQAADAIAASWPHVCQVLLFGSAARGEATAESDVDLVVIFDDLDYRYRQEIEAKLQGTISQLSGARFDLLVTDMPEWACRTQVVTMSVEADIASHAVALVSRDPQHEINYAKEMVLARNNWELGIKSLKVANDELDAILKTCRYVIAAESQEAPPADPEAAAEMLSDRCRGLLIQAHHSIEQSERALYRLNEFGSFGKGHDISRIEAKAAEKDPSLAQRIQTILNLIRQPDNRFVNWREGTYRWDEEQYLEATTPDAAAAHIQAAADMARLAADEAQRTAPPVPTASALKQIEKAHHLAAAVEPYATPTYLSTGP